MAEMIARILGKIVGRSLRIFAGLIDDFLLLAGCGAILYGTWLLSPVATWFVGGAISILLAAIIAIARRAI